MSHLDAAQRAQLIGSAQRSMLHFECQPEYAAGREHFERWLAGDDRPLPEVWPRFRDWLAMIAELVDDGRQVARVRVVAEPPTDYQRWESWCARWNIEAGEVVATIPMGEAVGADLLPAAGPEDWWLLDGERVLVQPVDETGDVVDAYVIDEQAEVARYRDLWARAVSTAAGTLPVA